MLEEARNLDMPSEQGVEQMFDSCCGLESTWGFVVILGLMKSAKQKRDDTRPPSTFHPSVMFFRCAQKSNLPLVVVGNSE